MTDGTREQRLAYAKLELERGNVDHAHQLLNEALNEDPEDWLTLFHIGSCHMMRNCAGTAINIFERVASKLGPDHPLIARVLNDLGVAYRKLNRNEAASNILEMASGKESNPRHKARSIANRAGCFVNNGTPDKALALYEEAMRLDPGNADLIYNSGLTYLEKGDWKEGFWRYDKGFESGHRAYKRYAGVAPWITGTDLRGKTVIVWGDQGLGDEIMGASCIPDLMRESGRVIFDCHPRMVDLFKRSFGIECHGTRKTNDREWFFDSKADYSIPLTTLYTLYRSNGEFPRTPFLKAKYERLPHDRPRVGISWEGGTAHNRSFERTIRLAEWEPTLREISKRADIYSLQYTPNASKEVDEFEEKSGIHVYHFPGMVQCEDYDKTAGFVAGLDLVVSICTSVVHLAGALDVPCWCITPRAAPWPMSKANGDSMPWYRSVKLLHQEKDGEWGPVFERITKDFEAFAA